MLYLSHMAHIALFQIKGWEEKYIKEKLAQEGFLVDSFEEGINTASVKDPSLYEAASVFVGPAVNKKTLEKFSKLKLVTTRSTGFDHIDLVYAKEKEIALGYVPHYGENTVAEFAMGLILTLSRKLYVGIDRIKEGRGFSFDGLEGFDLKGKTLGVIGTGRIGAHVIRMAKGFDMNIIASDAFPNNDLAKELGFSYVTLEELLAASDVITVHVPYLPSTHHLINAKNMEKVKRGAILINTARGAVVETQALVRALKNCSLAGAGLDVLEEEGVEKDEQGYWMRDADDDASEINLRTVLENNLLARMPQVVITPHNAFNTREAKMRILDADIQNISEFFKKGSVAHPIPVEKT